MNNPRALIVGISILGIAASASFAADEFQIFAQRDKQAHTSAFPYFQNGSIVSGLDAPSTESIIQAHQ